MQGEPLVTYSLTPHTRDALLDGLVLQLRALFEHGAARILTLHNRRTEFVRPAARVSSSGSASTDAAEGFVNVTPSGGEGSGTTEGGSDREEGGGGGPEEGVGGGDREAAQAEFEAFLQAVRKQGGGPYAMQVLSAHQV